MSGGANRRTCPHLVALSTSFEGLSSWEIASLGNFVAGSGRVRCRDLSGQCSDHSSKRETIMCRDRVCRASQSVIANLTNYTSQLEYNTNRLPHQMILSPFTSGNRGLTIVSVHIVSVPPLMRYSESTAYNGDTAHDSVYLISGGTAYNIN
eukprot:sb/3473510/